MGRRFWRQGVPGSALALATVLGACNGTRNDTANSGQSGAADSAAMMDTATTGMATRGR